MPLTGIYSDEGVAASPPFPYALRWRSAAKWRLLRMLQATDASEELFLFQFRQSDAKMAPLPSPKGDVMRMIRCLFVTALIAGASPLAAAQQSVGDELNSLVLTNTALQAEIKLTAGQKEKLKLTAEKVEAFNKEFAEALGPDAKVGFDKDQFQTKRMKLAEEMKKAVGETLTDGQQKRLNQLGIQVIMDFAVFDDPEDAVKAGRYTDAQKAVMKEAATALKLSDAQKTIVKGVVDGFRKQSRDIRTAAGYVAGNREVVDPDKVAAAKAEIDKLNKAAWVKVEATFDDTQKKAWRELVGEPFDRAKLRPAPKE